MSIENLDLGIELENQNLFQLHATATKNNEEVSFQQQQQQQQQQSQQQQSQQQQQSNQQEPPAEDPLVEKQIQDLIAKSLTSGSSQQQQQQQQSVDSQSVGKLFDTAFEMLVEEGFEKPDENDESLKDLSPTERFFNFIQTNINKKAEAIANDEISSVFENDPVKSEIAKDFFRHLKAGGAIEDFVAVRKHEDFTTDYLKTDDADLKKQRATRVLNAFYTQTGVNEQTAKSMINNLDASGLLESQAEALLPDIINNREKTKQTQAQMLEQQNAQKLQQIKEFNQQIVKAIDENNEFMSFDIKTKEQKQAVKEYLFLKNKDLNGVKVTGYAYDIAKARENPMFTLFQSLTLMNKGLDRENINRTASNAVKKDLIARMAKLDTTHTDNHQEQREEKANPRTFLDFENMHTPSFIKQ